MQILVAVASTPSGKELEQPTLGAIEDWSGAGFRTKQPLNAGQPTVSQVVKALNNQSCSGGSSSPPESSRVMGACDRWFPDCLPNTASFPSPVPHTLGPREQSCGVTTLFCGLGRWCVCKQGAAVTLVVPGVGGPTRRNGKQASELQHSAVLGLGIDWDGNLSECVSAGPRGQCTPRGVFVSS